MQTIFPLKTLATLTLAATLTVAFAGEHRPAVDHLPGVWVQVDEKTGKSQSLVRISAAPAASYVGMVEKIFAAAGEDENPRCAACTGAEKNQPIRGMRIISGLKRAAFDSDVYDSGEILDPDSGEVYRLKITVLETGKKLDVRGFIGVSLFGRSQIWSRAPVEAK